MDLNEFHEEELVLLSDNNIPSEYFDMGTLDAATSETHGESM